MKFFAVFTPGNPEEDRAARTMLQEIRGCLSPDMAINEGTGPGNERTLFLAAHIGVHTISLRAGASVAEQLGPLFGELNPALLAHLLQTTMGDPTPAPPVTALAAGPQGTLQLTDRPLTWGSEIALELGGAWLQVQVQWDDRHGWHGVAPQREHAGPTVALSLTPGLRARWTEGGAADRA